MERITKVGIGIVTTLAALFGITFMAVAATASTLLKYVYALTILLILWYALDYKIAISSIGYTIVICVAIMGIVCLALFDKITTVEK